MSNPPEAAHANLDSESLLNRKFGKEVVNYFSGMYMYM